MRFPLLLLPWLITAACAPGESHAAGPAQDAAGPSVILISIDTLRADHLGFHGYHRDTSPFLDRLAEESLVFENAFSPVAYTLSAHMTMLTGLLPAEHGVHREDLALSPKVPLLAEHLRAAGWQTAALYFRGLIDERYGFARGFELFREHANVEEAGVHLRDALDRLDRERPFFVFLHLFDVHSAPFQEDDRRIYRAPDPYAELFLEDDQAPLPDRPTRELWTQSEPLEPAQISTLVAHYDAAIRYVDARLEELLGELEREGWLADTLVIVTSDHGEGLGQRGNGLAGHGQVFQEGVHVPLLVRHPRGLRAGERVATPVHLTDIVPTVLDFAALPSDPRLGGSSLFGPLADDRVLAGSQMQRGYLVSWPRKWIRGGRGRVWEIDLDLDPHEVCAVEVSPEVLPPLLDAALGGRGPFPPAVPIRVEAQERVRLADLGYGGDD